MLTTALRFVPNFLADSEVTLDAQFLPRLFQPGQLRETPAFVCRGHQTAGHAGGGKSETLALSMELKGFGSNTYKNMPREPLGAADFIVLGLVVVLSTYPFWK